MKALLKLLIGVTLISSGLVFAQVQREPTPLPPKPAQDNLFSLGEELKLTHTVKVYWTTLDSIVTEIKVNAKGIRPTQIYCYRFSQGKNVQLFSTISPRCNYDILLSATGSNDEDKKGVTTFKTVGDGVVIVNVHGFEEKDFSQPPKVTVKYLRNGKVVGETSIVGER